MYKYAARTPLKTRVRTRVHGSYKRLLLFKKDPSTNFMSYSIINKGENSFVCMAEMETAYLSTSS